MSLYFSCSHKCPLIFHVFEPCARLARTWVLKTALYARDFFGRRASMTAIVGRCQIRLNGCPGHDQVHYRAWFDTSRRSSPTACANSKHGWERRVRTECGGSLSICCVATIQEGESKATTATLTAAVPTIAAASGDRGTAAERAQRAPSLHSPR